MSRTAWRSQRVSRRNQDGLLASRARPHTGPILRGYIYLALMVLLGSTTSPLAMVAVSEFPVGILPLLRFGFAGFVSSSLSLRPGALWRLLREDLPAGSRLSPPFASRSTRASSSTRSATAPTLTSASFTPSARWSSGSWRGCSVMRPLIWAGSGASWPASPAWP